MSSEQTNHTMSYIVNPDGTSEHIIIQIKPSYDKLMTLKKVRQMINSNIKDSVNFIILPECFNCPYGVKYFKEYAEELFITPKNHTIQILHEISVDYHEVYVIGGTIPEKKTINFIIHVQFG